MTESWDAMIYGGPLKRGYFADSFIRWLVEAYDARVESEFGGADGRLLVPVRVGEHTVLLSVDRGEASAARPGDEQEIASREPKIELVLDGVAEFAREVVKRLDGTKASKITVEFGCSVAMESGALLAVIGKASAQSTLKIGLEWSDPA